MVISEIFLTQIYDIIYVHPSTITQIFGNYFRRRKLCVQGRIQCIVENLRWSCSAKIANGFQVLTITTKKLHLRFSTWFQIYLWCFFLVCSKIKFFMFQFKKTQTKMLVSGHNVEVNVILFLTENKRTRKCSHI